MCSNPEKQERVSGPSLFLRWIYFGFMAIFVILPVGLVLITQTIAISILLQTGFLHVMTGHSVLALLQNAAGFMGLTSIMYMGNQLCKRQPLIKHHPKLIVGLICGIEWSLYMMIPQLNSRPSISFAVFVWSTTLLMTSVGLLILVWRQHQAIKKAGACSAAQ
jgi:hypothetical protein